MTAMLPSQAVFWRAWIPVVVVMVGISANVHVEAEMYTAGEGWLEGWESVPNEGQPHLRVYKRKGTTIDAEAYTKQHPQPTRLIYTQPQPQQAGIPVYRPQQATQPASQTYTQPQAQQAGIPVYRPQQNEPPDSQTCAQMQEPYNVAVYTHQTHEQKYTAAPKEESIPIRGYVYTSPQKEAEAILARIATAANIKQIPPIRVVSNPELNAYADGYKITFNDGMWNACNTEDQRAFIIGHELAHIMLKHRHRKVMQHVGLHTVRNVGLRVAGQFIPYRVGRYTNRPMWEASGVGLELATKKYSRVAEYQADDLGLRMMVEAGYDPEGAAEALTILNQGGSSGVPEFLATHPLVESRIHKLITKYKASNQ